MSNTKEGHTFDRTIANIAYCSKCGLVYLNNDFTRWCIKRGCNYSDDPIYAQARIRYTRREK